MNWNQNKILFNYILTHKYTIKKDSESNNILYINYNNTELKCKYLLLFSINNSNDILWSCDNPYIDQKTQTISLIIKNLLIEQNNLKNISYNNEIINGLKFILKNNTKINFNNELINLLWCLIGNIKEYKQIFIITEIIYF